MIYVHAWVLLASFVFLSLHGLSHAMVVTLLVLQLTRAFSEIVPKNTWHSTRPINIHEIGSIYFHVSHVKKKHQTFKTLDPWAHFFNDSTSPFWRVSSNKVIIILTLSHLNGGGFLFFHLDPGRQVAMQVMEIVPKIVFHEEMASWPLGKRKNTTSKNRPVAKYVSSAHGREQLFGCSPQSKRAWREGSGWMVLWL